MSRRPCTVDGCGKQSHARGLCYTHGYRQRVHGDTSVTNRGSVEERFWAKIQKGPSCWLWTAAVDNGGYGKFTETMHGKTHKAHRFAYEKLVGPVPEGMVLDHRCYVRLCCNPAHLRTVTTKQNGENRAGAPSNSQTGIRGVHLSKRGRYKVAAGHNGVHHFGGYFTDLEEAAEAARQLRLSLFTHNDIDRRTA